MSPLYTSILADFRQRTRHQKFIVILLTMSLLTLIYFPASDAGYSTLTVNGVRGIYNSAWVGLCLGLLNITFLPLICFYFIKNAIALDRQANMTELIAASSMQSWRYLLSKWIVNCCILLAIAGVMTIVSIFAQLYHGEDYSINIWHLLWPQFVYVLPTLLLISAIALMFETIPKLRGGLGNVIYFFLWVGGLVTFLESTGGIHSVLDIVRTDVKTIYPENTDVSNLGIIVKQSGQDIAVFEWAGITNIAPQLWSIFPSLLLTTLALTIAWWRFDRFVDQTRHYAKGSVQGKLSTLLEKTGIVLDKITRVLFSYSALTRLLHKEMNILFRGHGTLFYLIIIIGLMAQIFTSQQLLTSVVLPATWLGCVLILSCLGTQDKIANTEEIVCYHSQNNVSLILCKTLAAIGILIFVSLPGIARLILMGELMWLIQVAIAILFSVSFAMFCGVVTQTKRTFEAVYTALWYMGPLNGLPYLDYFGVNQAENWHLGLPPIFLLISTTLLAITLFKVHRQRN